jgi:DNA polymerase III alpha subunit
VTPPPAVAAAQDGTQITLTGRLVYVRSRITKQQRPWVSAVLRCSDGDTRIFVWPVPYETCRQHLAPRCTVEITGRVDKRDHRPVIVVAAATPTGGAQQ